MTSAQAGALTEGGELKSWTEGGILTLTLASAKTRNALSLSMMTALEDALIRAEAEDSVRVIVIDAEGPVFSAGHNLKELTAARGAADSGRAAFAETFALCGRLMSRIARQPQPVIASVAGLATAAGCQLVAACDLAIAGTSARFATPGVDIGLFCSTPAVALSRAVPLKAALEMLLTGEPIGAERALAIGLINRIAPDVDLDEETSALARTIASKPAAIIRLGKRAFAEQAALPLEAAYQRMSEVMTDNMLRLEAEEGIGAFLGKRPPNWP